MQEPGRRARQAVALQLRTDDRALDDAGGVADAEEEGVRAAADGDAGGVVGVEGDVGEKVVAGGSGRADAADAVVGLRILAAFRHVGPAGIDGAAGEVARDPADLGGGGEGEQLPENESGALVHG